MGIRFTVRSAPPAPPAPKPSIKDTFTAADDTTLAGRSTETLSRAWAVETVGTATTVPGIKGNALVALSGTGNRTATIDVGQADYTMDFTVTGDPQSGAARQAYAVVRSDGAGAGWAVGQNWGGAQTWAIYRLANGAGQSTGATQLNVAPAKGDKVSLVVKGNLLTVKVNGAQIGSPYDMTTYHLTNTRAGLSVRGGFPDGIDDMTITPA